MNNFISTIKVEDIIPTNYQNYNEKEINELAASIKQLGMLEPLIVKSNKDKYEILIGNKRYKAALIAKLKTVPAIINNDLIDPNLSNNKSSIPKEILLSSQNSNNLDVVNLSSLNKEYERDELKMNNNQITNTNTTATPINNEPTFGERFFPSLEDEPTNMNFSLNTEPQSPISPSSNNTPSTNNFIDLTDLNNINTQPTNNSTQLNSNTITQNLSQPTIPVTNNNQPLSIANNNPTMDNNILDLSGLRQNQEYPIPATNSTMQIDNEFQEIINDFSPNTNNPVKPELEPISNINIPNQSPTPPLAETQPNIISPDIVTPNTPNPEPFINREMLQPNNIEQPLPVSDQILNQPVETISEKTSPVSKKDVTPVINTLKSLAVNLESFGYNIRITDENLSSSYKITIEVDK